MNCLNETVGRFLRSVKFGDLTESILATLLWGPDVPFQWLQLSKGCAVCGLSLNSQPTKPIKLAKQKSTRRQFTKSNSTEVKSSMGNDLENPIAVREDNSNDEKTRDDDTLHSVTELSLRTETAEEPSPSTKNRTGK